MMRVNCLWIRAASDLSDLRTRVTKRKKDDIVSREQRLRTMLYYGGTSVLNVSCHMITHLVLSENCTKAMEKEARERCKSNVRVVNVNWILSSVRRRKVDTDSKFEWKERRSVERTWCFESYSHHEHLNSMSPSKHTGTSSNDGGGSVFEIGGKNVVVRCRTK